MINNDKTFSAKKSRCAKLQRLLQRPTSQKHTFVSVFVLFFPGLNTNNKKRCSSHKNSRVNVTFNDEIQWTQTKCDTNEGQTCLREKEPPSENSSSSNDPYSINDVNKGLSFSVLDLYSDDELNEKSHVSKEPVPINVSAVSVEAKTDPLPKTKADSQSFPYLP